MSVKLIFHGSQVPYPCNKLNGEGKLERSLSTFDSIIRRTLGNFDNTILVEDVNLKHTFPEGRMRR